MLKSAILSLALTLIPTAAIAQSSNWQEIATLQGGGSLQINLSSVRTRQMPGRAEEVVFRARMQYDNSRTDGTFAATCSTPDLWQLSSYELSQDIQLPLTPGTVAEALWVWACG